MQQRFLFVPLLVLLVNIPVHAQDSKTKRPNVLFIAIDDLNDWTGSLGGHPQAHTPNLDRLAKKGVLFTRAYCSAPACNPSRASLLTGVRPSTSGVYLNPQPWRPALPNAVTLMRYFMMHGYHVMGGGKIFHGRFPDKGSWHEYFKGKYNIPKGARTNIGIGGNMMWGPLDVDDDAMADTQLTDWAIKKLKQKHEKPFFLAVGYVKPHLTWHAPKKYFQLHPLDKIMLPKTMKNDLDDVPPAGVRMARPDGDHRKITKANLWHSAVQAYLATSTYMDAQLGRLIEAFESSAYAENTIIILWSDHGWHLGEKEHWRKFALWEEACRVVFLAVAPDVTRPNQQCHRTVNLMDIYPTLVDLAGLPQRKGLEGNSLTPLLRNPSAEWSHPSITTHGRNNHAVRTEKWRYIRYANGSEELYDHDADPYEWKNLAKNPKYASLKKELAKHFPKVNVPNAPYEKKKGKKKKGAKKKKSATSMLYLPHDTRTSTVTAITIESATAYLREE